MHRNLWAAMGRVQVPQMIPSGEAEEPMTRATQVNASSASVTSCFLAVMLEHFQLECLLMVVEETLTVRVSA